VNRKPVLLLALLVVAAAVLGTLAVNEVRARWAAPLAIPEGGFLFTIERGDSLAAVVDKLHAAGVIPHPDLVVLYGRWTGQDQRIKRGEYRLQPGLTARTLLDMLQRGEVVSYQVTLPEGITLRTAIDMLAQQPQLDVVLEGAGDPRIAELIAPYTQPEGLFFPDSYRFVRGDTDWSILKRAHATMRAVLEEEWQGRAGGLPYETPYEALIMASIIERETGVSAERGRIAGVFVRRLQRGMLLQTDPTVIYGLGEGFDGNLVRAHLSEEDNVYNTYRHAGLPPTPIALPGRAAIRAALHPEPGTALYFVARGDGGHVFSDSLKEHNRAVRDHQLKRREDYRSTPVGSP
jgi:UPF0755 protein